MKGVIVGFFMIIACVAGLVAEVALMGGNSPRIDTSVDTRAQIGIGLCIVGIAGVVVVLTSVWMMGRRSFNDGRGA